MARAISGAREIHRNSLVVWKTGYCLANEPLKVIWQCNTAQLRDGQFPVMLLGWCSADDLPPTAQRFLGAGDLTADAGTQQVQG